VKNSKREFEILDVVRILWKDANTITNLATTEELKTQGLSWVSTAGFFVHENEEVIMTASDLCGNGRWKYTSIIPKAHIGEIKLLERLPEKERKRITKMIEGE